MEKKYCSILESPDLFEEKNEEEDEDVCFLLLFAIERHLLLS